MALNVSKHASYLFKSSWVTTDSNSTLVCFHGWFLEVRLVILITFCLRFLGFFSNWIEYYSDIVRFKFFAHNECTNKATRS